MHSRFRNATIISLLLTAAYHTIGQPTVGNASRADFEDIARSTRWLDSTPTNTSLPQRLSAILRQQDVLSYVAPGILYPSRNIGLQCQEVNNTLADVPHRLAMVSTTAGKLERRFGEIEFEGSRVFRLQLSADDVLPSGVSPRCELVPYPMPGSALPQGETFWLGFSIWADDWKGTQDEQLIAQMHTQDPRNIALNPFFALVIRGNELRVEVRHNIQLLPDKTSTKLATPTRITLPTRQWVTFVVQARISTLHENTPFLRLWLNGNQVTDYSGLIGYSMPPGAFAYPKVGIYHWLANNAWDRKILTRSVLVGSMIALLDTDTRYKPDIIRAALAVPANR